MSKSKLTTMQIKEINEKYAAGMTQVALANEYGVSQSLIQKRLVGPHRNYNKANIKINTKYIGIRNYMLDNNLSIRALAKCCNMDYVALYYILNGRTAPRKTTIDKVLNATGMKYEEAFEVE